MACILFVYGRSSIQAAKRNAQRHREADGGQINWENENMRRHGSLPPPGNADKGTVRELMGEIKKQVKGDEPIKPTKKGGS